jgi:serine/threonine protein kinase
LVVSRADDPSIQAVLKAPKTRSVRIDVLDTELKVYSAIQAATRDGEKEGGHQCVLRMLDFAMHDPCGLVLEACPLGSLSRLIHQWSEYGSSVPESSAIIFVEQLVDAVLFLHANRIMHRDIKPDNILCSGGMIKVHRMPPLPPRRCLAVAAAT